MGREAYLAIDVGATKTLFAVFDKSGEVICECKIKTNPNYEQFKAGIAQEAAELAKEFSFSHCCLALPTRYSNITRSSVDHFGNLPWVNVPVIKDLESLLPDTKVLYHNDAKLAGLSEAILLQGKYKKVLYMTISTGIGGGVITNGVIDADFANFEPGQMVFEHDGKTQTWEDFASGRALKERYGKLASEIDDPQIWREYANTLVIGLEDVLANVQPDAVIVGGGVGAHLDKFKSFLEEGLNKINNPLVPTPPLLKAQRPEEAVIYGCYEYIKQNA